MSARLTPPAFWDRMAERYAARPMSDPAAYETALGRVLAHLTPADHVLEIGCGTGTTALRLAGAVAHVTATDYAGAMIDITRRRAEEAGLTNLVAQQASPDDPALGAAHFDAVCAFNLLHLLPDLEAALAAIRARVRPGGLFISKTPCLGHALHYRVIVGALSLAGILPRMTFLTPTMLETAITAAGFEIVETGTYPEAPPGRLIVARRRDQAEMPT